MRQLLCNFGIIAIFGVSLAQAHEEGAPFSGAIIEPLETHHAHIEDEQKLNLFYLNGFRSDDGERSGYKTSLEFAVDWTGGFSLGSEVFIPFENTGVDEDEFALGDIELQPVKYSFIRSPETILTAILAVSLPTGDEDRELGSGETSLGGLLFIDQAYRNWYFGGNVEMFARASGPSETELELAAVMAYTFAQIDSSGMVPPKPGERIVPAISIELISESILSGDEEGGNVVNILPGIHVWDTKSGMQVRLGTAIPLSSDKEDDFTVLLQVGNHVSWFGGA